MVVSKMRLANYDNRLLSIKCREVVVRTSTDWLPPVHPSVKAATEIMRASFQQPIGTDQILVVGLFHLSLPCGRNTA